MDSENKNHPFSFEENNLGDPRSLLSYNIKKFLPRMKTTIGKQNQKMKEEDKGGKEREIPKILFKLTSLPIAESDHYLIS